MHFDFDINYNLDISSSPRKFQRLYIEHKMYGVDATPIRKGCPVVVQEGP